MGTIKAVTSELRTDKKGGRWLLLNLGETSLLDYDYVSISPDYAPADGAFAFTDDLARAIEGFPDEFSAAHKMQKGAAEYTDGNGKVWALVWQTHLLFPDTVVAATRAYGKGVVIEGHSQSDVLAGITNFITVAPPVVPPIVIPSGGGGIAPLTEADYRALGDVAKTIGAEALDLFAMLYAESRLKTWAAAKNAAGQPVALGVGQLTRLGASSIAMSEAQWATIPTLSFIQQLDLVRRYFQKWNRSGSTKNATTLHQTNFAPNTVGSDVVYRAPSIEYQANSNLDKAKKGFIDINDLSAFLEEAAAEGDFKVHLARLNALGYHGVPNIRGGGSSIASLAILGILGAGLFYFAGSDQNGKRPSLSAALPGRAMMSSVRSKFNSWRAKPDPAPGRA